MTLSTLIEERSGGGWLRGLALLLAACVLAPMMAARPLETAEAVVAGAARSIMETGDFWRLSILGQPLHQQPLYSWILASCGFASGPVWLLRLPSLAGLVGISSLSWYVARRAAGAFAGFIAALVVLTSAGGLLYAQQAANDIWAAFGLFSAWAAWYHFGAARDRWNLAWGLAIACVVVAFFAGGIQVFTVFYVPLFLLLKPVRGRDQMLWWLHPILLVAGLAFCASWLAHSLRHAEMVTWEQLVETAVAVPSRSYVQRLWQFPLRAVGLAMPWALVAWPGFCRAFRAVEKDHEQARYWRRIIGVLFVLCWLLPGVPARALLPLLGPFAVLTALNYENLIRRHSTGLRLALRRIEWGGLAAGGGLLAGGILVRAGGIVVPELETWEVNWLLIGGTTAFAVPCIALSANDRRIWLRLALLAVTAACIWQTLAMPVAALEHERPSAVAEDLTKHVPAPATIYSLRIGVAIAPVSHYIEQTQKPLDSIEELPVEEDEPYLLAGLTPPVHELFEWHPVSVPKELRSGSREIRVTWAPAKGVLCRIEAERPARTPQPGTPEARRWSRVYRGIARALDTGRTTNGRIREERPIAW